MDEIQQTQKAGDNAVQNQIGTQIVVGITEKRVREICDEKIAIAIRDLSFDASDLAHQRINTLTDKVVEKIKKNPTHIQAFSDPSFQRDIVRAQIAAAESDREPDNEIQPTINEKREIIPCVRSTAMIQANATPLMYFCQMNTKCLMN